MEIKADLISRSAAIEAALDGADEWDGGCSPTREEYIREHMAKVPAVDAAPVVHGEWKWSHGGQCSECGFHNSNFGYTYCPNCGARMDGEANG